MKKVVFKKIYRLEIDRVRDWKVLVDGEMVGGLEHTFSSARHKRNCFGLDSHVAYLPEAQYARRRGWWTDHPLDVYLGYCVTAVEHNAARYVQFPLYELKALIRHVITNGVNVATLEPKELIALAQHCRAIELAQRRGR